MCNFIEYKVKYDRCTVDPKHVIPVRKYDTDGCKKYKETGYNCGDEATPAKGINGEVIQLASTTQPGACPQCLS